MRKITAMLAVALLATAAPIVRAAHADDSNGTPWLGVYTQTVDDPLREALDLVGDGALVSRVIAGSPADRAGVRKGDVITRFGSRPISSADQLIEQVRDAKIGQTVTIEVRRGADSRTFTARLEERPADARAFVAPREGDEPEAPGTRRIVIREKGEGTPGEQKHVRILRRGAGDRDFDIEIPEGAELEHLRGLPRLRGLAPEGPGRMMMMGVGRGRLGVQVQNLNAQLGEYFEVPDGRGALVMEVMKDTPAERAGLKAGDVITRVGGTTVANPSDLIEALQGKEGKVEVTVVRKGRPVTLEPELEAAGPGRMRMESGDDDRLAPEPPAAREDLGNMRDELRALREEVRRLRSELESSRGK